jgi:hypothetical protein
MDYGTHHRNDRQNNMIGKVDQWLQLPEIARMFGLSEESIKRLAKTHGLPLRRVTPFATPGVLESEHVHWLKGQPQVGAPVRSKRSAKSKRLAPRR